LQYAELSLYIHIHLTILFIALVLINNVDILWHLCFSCIHYCIFVVL